MPRDETNLEEYERGRRVPDILPVTSVGIVTSRDALVVAFDPADLRRRIADFTAHEMSDEELGEQYLSSRDGLSVVTARRDMRCDQNLSDAFCKCLYRPFDSRWLFYHQALIERARLDVMSHMLAGKNLAVVTTRQITSLQFCHAIVTRLVTEYKLGSHDRNSQIFPIYLYEGRGGLLETHYWQPDDLGRVPNLDRGFVAAVSGQLGLQFTPYAPSDQEATFGPEDVLHYVYSLLYSPAYRQRYAEFLKTDFPRIPIPSNRKAWSALCCKGADLVALHLLENDYEAASWNQPGAKVGDPLECPITDSAADYEPEVAKGHPKYKHGKVFINKVSYFNGVPEDVWNFQVGGYQVCHKWLKDRRGRVLSGEDIEHYQKIVVALNETIRLMGEIDQTIEQHGGWPDAFITEPLDTESKEASPAVSVPQPAGKAEKKQDSSKGDFKLRPNKRTVTGRLALSARKEKPKQRSRGKAPSITDFDRDQLKEAVLEVVGTDWIERDDAIRAAARHLGFKRTGKRIHKAFASAITGLLRQGRLEYDGSLVRRSP